jgi:hypothetical protein
MTDLESALRTMLRERAADIATLPADFGDIEGLDRPDRGADDDRRGRWWTFTAAAAVAAVVAVVVAVTVAVNERDSRPVHPAAPTTSGASPAPGLHPGCTTTLPGSWSTALTSHSTFGADRALLLAVSSTGTSVVARDFGTTRDVVLVAPGSGPRKIFTVARPDDQDVLSASIEGDWVLVPVMHAPRNANGVIATVHDLVLVNSATHAVRTIAHVSEADDTTINGAAMQDGHVYWDVKPTFGSKTGTIQEYDIASKQVRTMYTGAVDAPIEHAARITWLSGTVDRSHDLAPAVTEAIRDPRAASSLVTDGTAYAWITTSGRIGWWTSGAARATQLLLPATVAPGRHEAARLVVAGRYVYLERGADDARRLIDMGSGAIAATTAVLLYGGGGTFGGVDELKLPQSAVLINTAVLPGLHC